MADQPDPQTPLLDLDTLVVRRSIAIDGVRYEVFSPDEMSVLQSHRLGVWGRRIDVLAKSDDAGDGEELEHLIGLVARAALVDCPEEVINKLSGAQQQAVADVFTALLFRSKLGVTGAMATAMGVPIEALPTGARSSPGSSGSTEEAPVTGWRKLLQRLSGRI